MSTVTQCPACSTRFKVTQEQLDAYHGMVRCGRCQTVFNAIENLYDDGPSPQLDLPIMLEEAAPEEPVTMVTAPKAKADITITGNEELSRPPLTSETAQEPATSRPPEVSPAKEDEFLAAAPKKKGSRWPRAIAGLLLLLLLLAQVAYFFRVELAARLPGLKPMLVSYCGLLDCQITLPMDADLMSIDSSDLEADPDHANVITLTAILRNHASYTQAYPDLELTLNDLNDKPVARRTFRPTEYLQKGNNEKQGLAGGHELNIEVHLDTADLKPSGYRLLLFYPK